MHFKHILQETHALCIYNEGVYLRLPMANDTFAWFEWDDERMYQLEDPVVVADFEATYQSALGNSG